MGVQCLLLSALYAPVALGWYSVDLLFKASDYLATLWARIDANRRREVMKRKTEKIIRN